MELKHFGLQDKYSSLIQGLEDGFHLGVPKILHTYTLLNNHSVNNLHVVYNNILENEFAAGWYIGPIMCCQLEAELGPFQMSLLSLIPKASNQANTWQFMAFCTHIHPLLKQLPSACTSTALTSPAHGEPFHGGPTYCSTPSRCTCFSAGLSRYNRSWLDPTWVVLGLSSWRRARYRSFCLESRPARLKHWLNSLAQTTLHCSSLSW